MLLPVTIRNWPLSLTQTRTRVTGGDSCWVTAAIVVPINSRATAVTISFVDVLRVRMILLMKSTVVF